MDQRKSNAMTAEQPTPDLALAPLPLLIALPVIVFRSFSSAC